VVDYGYLRREMVDVQLRSRGIANPRVLGAILRVPREEFFPDDLRSFAYEDAAFPIGEGQTVSQPYMVAIMTELLKLKGSEKVLEVGTGSGYQAAILAELCRKVITIERIGPLSENAKARLKNLGYQNIEFVVGDGSEGYSAGAPYDGIIVTAACPDIPPPLIEQLAEGGRLVLPIGERHLQTLTVVTKEKGKLKTEESIGCVFVPLVGKYGWQNT
jgi:protein-L-isoaspartate(D-aspartate) O-methyltransferase